MLHAPHIYSRDTLCMCVLWGIWLTGYVALRRASVFSQTFIVCTCLKISYAQESSRNWNKKGFPCPLEKYRPRIEGHISACMFFIKLSGAL